MEFTPFLLILLAYLLGSICSAIVVCKILRLPDPRSTGSGNPGTTNVKRVGGTRAAAWTLLGDAFKGYFSVCLALQLEQSSRVVGCVLLAVFLGHIFPIFFKLKGGKGWATALGGMFALDPLFGLFVLLTWLAAVRLFRVSAVGALTAGVLAPTYGFLIVPVQPYLLFLSAISMLLLWTHRGNIKALF